MACNTFQMLKTSNSLVHDFEDHIQCLSPGVLGNNQLKYVWNHTKGVRLPLKAQCAGQISDIFSFDDSI